MNFWSHSLAIAILQISEQRQTVRSHALPPRRVRYRGVPLLRSRSGANHLPGGRADTFVGLCILFLAEIRLPQSFHLCRARPFRGASEHLFYSLNHRTKRISCVCLGFPRSHQPGLRRCYPLRKFHGGDFDLSLIGASADTKLHIRTDNRKVLPTMDRVAAMLVLLGLLVVSDLCYYMM